MKKLPISKAISAIILSSSLAACGGSGGGSNNDNNETLDSGDSITSSGTVSRFGSVFINNVRYETSSSRIVSSDDNSTLIEDPSNAQVQTIIGLGDVITVQGSLRDNSNGVADIIYIDNELLGEIDSVSVSDGSFILLGQTISVTPETIIDDSLIEAVRGTEIPNDLSFGDPSITEPLDQLLPIGTLVEVSGFPSQNGFEATRIESKTELQLSGVSFDVEVKGTVSNLSIDQFTINGLTVLYDTNDLDSEDFRNTTISNGQFVEVHGSVINSNTIEANRIEREDSRFDDDSRFGNSRLFEIEGIIQSINPDESGDGGIITINGIDIRVNNIISFTEGLRIEIKARRLSNGSFEIVRIQDESEDTLRIQDQVVSADETQLTTRLGLSISPQERTRLKDKTELADDDSSISSFLNNSIGTSIKARGFPLNGEMVWTRLEIKDDNKQDCRIRGSVNNIMGDESDFSFTIQGVTINTSQVSDNNFESGNDLVIGRSAFFSSLDEGDIVQAKSDNNGIGCSNGELTAREIEFEMNDSLLFGSFDNSNSNSNNTSPNNFDNELTGAVSNISATSFELSGRTISVTDQTIIDDSLIEAALGFEIDNEDTFGNLSFTLNELLSEGMFVEVRVNSNNEALEIEDL